MRTAMKAALLALLVLSLAMPLRVAAEQPPPHRFHGTVTVRSMAGGAGQDAPTGTTVSARIGGVERGAFYVTEAGRYGNAGVGSYLLVWYDGGDGVAIEFYVDGNLADQSAEFHSGEVTELNLTAYIPSSGQLGTPTSVPPALTGGGTVAPPGGGVTTDDGRCNLYFYPGAFANEAQVTIGPVSCGAAPQGFSVASTCFSISATVDGEPVSDLAADMSIEVRYRPADLAAAGGDASSLRLAYYDGGAGGWQVLPTGVDAAAWTLTATTAHLSDWAVLGRAPSGGMTWWPFVVIALAVVAVIVVVVLVARRRRRPPPRRRRPAPRPRPAQ